MKNMTKVLLVICTMILGLTLCGCTERTEAVEATMATVGFEPFWIQEKIDGIIHVSTNDTYRYDQLIWKLQDNNNCEIIDTVDKFNDDTKEWDCQVWYRVYPVEELSRCFNRTYLSFEDYQTDLAFNEKLETGKYEIKSETLRDSGAYSLVIVENVKAVQSKESENEFTFTVSEDEGYLGIVRWLVEEIGYEIVDIHVNDFDDGWTYDITYNKTDAISKATISNVKYMYAVAKCTVEGAEKTRVELLEKGYEIIGESNLPLNNGYLFTYRIPQQ